MADVYEKNLEQKASLTVDDYIRVVGSDNVSYKQLVSDVANKIITTYSGATLAGSAQSVKSAIDSLNSKTTFQVITPSSVPDFITLNSGYTIRNLVVVQYGKVLTADFVLYRNVETTANTTIEVGYINQGYRPVINSGCVSPSFRGAIASQGGQLTLRPFNNISANSGERVMFLYMMY